MGYSRDPRHLHKACHCKPGTPSSDLLYLDVGDKPQSRYGEESSHIGEEALHQINDQKGECPSSSIFGIVAAGHQWVDMLRFMLGREIIDKPA